MSVVVEDTSSRQRKSWFRNPWFVPVGGGLISAVGPNPLGVSTLGIFVVAITADVGWGRTQVTSGFTVAALGMALGFLVLSRLLDRIALRFVMVPSLVGFLLGVAMLSVAPPNHLLWLFTWGWLGFFGAGAIVPPSKATLSWFDNNRGLAVGIAAAIGGFGTTLIPIVATSLSSSIGWRATYQVLAAGAAIIAFGSLFLFVRVRGERHIRGRLVQEVKKKDGDVVSLELPGLTPRQALGSRHFWMIIIGLNISAVAVTGVAIHLVPMMMDRGLSALEAASLLSLFGVGGVVGRILGGLLLDRIHGTIVGSVVLLVPAIGLLLLDEPYALAAVAVACIGFAAGVEGDLTAFFTTRYLGTRSIGFFLSLLWCVNLLMAAFGPLMLGIVYDATGSYDGFVPILVGALLLASLLIALLGRYRYPAIPNFDRTARNDELESSKLLAQEAEQQDKSESDLPRSSAVVDS